MSLFSNNYKKLVKENRNALAEMPGASFAVLNRMFKYLETFDVSRFELEVIKKDLIGLAEEAQMEEIDFKDKIGMPEKKFCDSLLKDGIKPSHLERIIPMVRDLIIVDLFLYAISWKLEGLPRIYGITTDIIVADLMYCVWVYVVTLMLQRKRAEYALAGTKRKKESIYNVMFLLAVVIFVVSGLPMANIPEIIIHGNGYVIFAALLVLSGCAFWGNNYYWNKCSEKYNWR